MSNDAPDLEALVRDGRLRLQPVDADALVAMLDAADADVAAAALVVAQSVSRRLVPLAAAAALVATLAGAAPVTAAATLVALELHMTPSPAAYGSQVVLDGAVTRVAGSPTNVRVGIEFSGSFTDGACEPECSYAHFGHLEWEFPTVTGRTTFRYTASATGLGEYVRLFLLGGNAGCAGVCPAEIKLQAPVVRSTLTYQAGHQVVAGTSIRIRAGVSANAQPIQGTLVVELPPGIGEPVNLPPGATYHAEPWAGVEALITASPSASIEFDAPITAPNGSSLIVTTSFMPSAGTPAASTGSMTVKVGHDGTRPVARAPKARLTTGWRVAGAPVVISWSGSDTGSGIERYVLAQQKDGAAWTTVSTSLTGTSTTRVLASGHTYRYKVRAIDHAGNTGDWATGASIRLAGFAESSSSLAYAGTWSRATSSAYWGGRARFASRAGATATFRTTSRSVSWVAYRGPTRGRAAVYVNGSKVATVDLWAPTGQPQRVVWARSWSTVARRTVTIKLLTAYGRQRVEIDGLQSIR